MPGIVSRITAFARSPRGQAAIRTATEKAREAANDPRTRAKLAQLGKQLGQRRRGGGGR